MKRNSSHTHARSHGGRSHAHSHDHSGSHAHDHDHHEPRLVKKTHGKKANSLRIFVILAVSCALFYGASVYFSKRSTADEVAVKINNKKIYRSEIEEKLREVFAGGDNNLQMPELNNFPSEVIETFAKEIYLEKELVHLAKKSGLHKQQEIKREVESSFNRILANAYIDSLIKEKVSEEKLREKYAEMNGSNVGKKEYLVSHIVAKTKQEATKIRDQLVAKKSKIRFSDLAKKYSIDKESANSGGNLGYLLEENMVKEVATIVVKMKKNDVSSPIQTKNGWHLVKLEDVKENKQKSFEEVKESLRDQMIKGETDAIYKEIFDQVKVKNLLAKTESKENEEAKSSEKAEPTEKFQSKK